MDDARSYHGTLDDALARLPEPGGKRSATVFRHGTLDLKVYAPRGEDPQLPHDLDEVYIVVSGSGWFVNGDERHRFGPGDVMFVPARQEHRFEAFTDDFVTWVVFYGPEGGEAP